MIFVTVGTQLPFDRLIGAVDLWARSHPEVEAFAQIGPGGRPPRHLDHAELLPPSRTTELIERAELVVAHAGMGSVLTALRSRKAILVLPRRAEWGEHRNDHQVATARWLSTRAGVHVAWTAEEIPGRLDAREAMVSGPQLPEFASGPLIAALAEFIRG